MTQYPEVILARELEICYASVGLVTDYDAGLVVDKKVKPVTTSQVINYFQKNIVRTKKLMLEVIKTLPAQAGLPSKRNCLCSRALQEARFS
jgi:5'-methylthioadenosine phosphorylase